MLQQARRSPRKGRQVVTNLSAETINSDARETSVNLMSRSSVGSMPLCMSKSQHEAALNATSPSRRPQRLLNQPVGVLGNVEISENLERAFQMFYTYPTLKVAGTAFENSLRRQRPEVIAPLQVANDLDTEESFGASMSRQLNPSQVVQSSSNTFSLLESSSVMQNVILENGERDGSSVRFVRISNMVRVATAIKRAAMWQTIIVNVLAQEHMSNAFRFGRLRSTVVRVMLPVLMERKESTGSIIPSQMRRKGTGQAGVEKMASTDTLHGVYLKEHSEFMASLSSSILLENFADTMERQRYLPGETIASAGEPSQKKLRFLVSGKCECRCQTSQSVDGGNSFPTTSKPKILHAGNTFGGIFGSCAVFEGTYRAISQCIVWVLTAEDFERLFVPYADATMLSKYVEAIRMHHEERLRTKYPVPTVMPRVPIYRRLNQPLDRYYADFTPVVKVRGEVLLEQGAPPGDVYCMVEGCVRRQSKGENNVYHTGTSQLLMLNNFTSLNLSGRFVLMGEEPHVLPGVQRYRCVVHSRAALFFRISGERFVSALLDDPTLYMSLRDTLTKIICSNMKLDPTALSFVPILQHFPQQSLLQLAQVATPSVVGRSMSMCESAHPISKIFLVTAGDVRDLRAYGHLPTKRLPTPPPSPSDSDDEDADRPGYRPPARSALERKKRMNREQHKKRKTAVVPHAPAVAKSSDSEETLTWSFSIGDAPPGIPEALQSKPSMKASVTFDDTSGTAGRQNVANPDEKSEFNPPLPAQPSTRFLFTLGGGWEGLLLEKWGNGWETTTTVESWSIPMLNIRTEFNNCSKSVQSAILLAARMQQKEELGLPSLSTAKLPPMSIYLPPEKVVVREDKERRRGKHRRAVPTRSASRGTTGRRGQGDEKSGGRGGVGPGDSFLATDEFFMSESFPGVSSPTPAPGMGVRGSLVSGETPITNASPENRRRSSRSFTLAKITGANSDRKRPAVKDGLLPFLAGLPAPAGEVKPLVPVATLTAQLDCAIPPRFRLRHLQQQHQTNGGVPVLNSSTAPRDEAAELAHNRRLAALYNGEFKNEDLLAFTNIVREPATVVSPKLKRHPLSAETRLGTEPLSAVMWPSQSRGRETLWFHDVPSYEPLPGTSTEVPITLDTNTALLTQHSKELVRVLEAEADYFSETIGSRPRSQATENKFFCGRDLPKRHAMILNDG